MASPLAKINGKLHIRSISLPSRSHPTTLKIEEELYKLRSLEVTLTSSFESIQTGLSGLDELYRCLNVLVNMSSTTQVISHNKHESCINELLDSSVQLLDVCGIARDIILQIKEHVQALQSVFRRRKVDTSTETCLADYMKFRKKAKKESRRLIREMKQMEGKFTPLSTQDHHFSAVMRVLREVNDFSTSLFQSVLIPFSGPWPVLSRWSLIAKVIHKGVLVWDEKQEDENDLQRVDASVCALTKCPSGDEPGAENVQIVQEQLKDLEMSLGNLENGLENVFRWLIKSRASLLNIISQ